MSTEELNNYENENVNESNNANQNEHLKTENKKMKINYLTTIQKNQMKINNGSDAYLIFTSLLAHEENLSIDKEHLWLLAIDENAYVCSAYLLATQLDNIKTLNASDLFRDAIKHDAKKIIIGHNQTNCGKFTVDTEELDYTSEIYHKARILGIELCDHIIINKESLTSSTPIYYSYSENRFMEFIEQDPTYKTVSEAHAEIEREKQDCYEHGKEDKTQEIVESLLSKGLDLIDTAEYSNVSVQKVREIAEGGIA